jgi:hypothetical protein
LACGRQLTVIIELKCLVKCYSHFII